MPQTPNVTNIPSTRVPFLNTETGLISRDWYMFLFNLFNLAGGGNTPISLQDLQVGPPSENIDFQSLITNAQFTNTQDASVEYLDNLTKQIQELSVAPANTPQLPRKRYGSFYDTTTQNAAAINTAYAMTFNSTDTTATLGVNIGTPASRIYVDTPNIYNIQFSSQLYNTGGGANLMYIWLRKNGADIPNSTTLVRVQGNNTQAVAAWNFLLSMNAGDYFELMWAVDNTSLNMPTFAATAFCPAVPSIILTVTDNIGN